MELENSEFAKALEEAVGRFFELDTACERVKEKGICDVVGVKCDSSCKIYVRKEKWLNTLSSSSSKPTKAFRLQSRNLSQNPAWSQRNRRGRRRGFALHVE